ncbi:transposase [Chryseobacterium glaciei]|uniref:transposase n=1 Tax=Chryseobacterium glaciei TaxID=1685010 RepID=UPI00082BBE7E|nr:transposase [Chryseobacterium glaciei]
MVSVANVHDSKAVLLLMKTLRYLLIPLQVILADGGYRGEIIEEIKTKFGYTIQIVMRNDKKEKKFEPHS